MLPQILHFRDRMVARVPQLMPAHPAYRWLVLVTSSVTMVMSVLDTTIVNVAIARLQVVFSASTDTVQWVITAYLLAFAVMLGAAGWLADRFGYKTVFMAAIALFTAGSLLCSLSWNITSLILFRIVQGIGGGMMGPVSMAIVMREFPKERRGMAMGVYSIFAIAFSTFGPTLGGWMLDNYSWHMMFDINVPLGILGLAGAFVVFRQYRADAIQKFDYAGFAGLALFLGAALLALADGNASWNTDGWGSTFILVCFALSGTGLVVFLIAEFTVEHPMVDLKLFANYNFSLGGVVMFVFGLGIFGSDFLLPLYMQTALGYSPFKTGLLFLPMGAAMAVFAVIGGRLTDRIGPKAPGLVGIILRAYGMYRFVFLSPYSSMNEIVVVATIMGVGMGLIMSPLQTMLIASRPDNRLAQASGLIQIIRQLGGSFGVAILSTTLTHRNQFHLASLGQAVSSASPAFRGAISRLSTEAAHLWGAGTGAAARSAQGAIVGTIANHAFVSAIDDVFLIAMIVSIVSSIPFLFLESPRKGKGRTPAPEPEPA